MDDKSIAPENQADPKKKPGRTPKPVPAFVEGLPAGEVVILPLSELNLEDHTFEFRISTRVGDLVESLQREGQQIPILVRGQVPYQVVSGFRRLRAIQQLGWSQVTAIVRDLDDDQAYALSYLENEIRQDYGPLDRANAVVKLRAAGKPYAEIGRLYGLGAKQVKNYELLLDFNEVLRAGVEGGALSPTHALLLHQAGRGQPDFDHAAWLQRVVDERLSVAQLKRALGKAKPAKAAARLFERRGEGFRLYPMAFQPGKTTAEARQRLIEALEQALRLGQAQP